MEVDDGVIFGGSKKDYRTSCTAQFCSYRVKKLCSIRKVDKLYIFKFYIFKSLTFQLILLPTSVSLS